MRVRSLLRDLKLCDIFFFFWLECFGGWDPTMKGTTLALVWSAAERGEDGGCLWEGEN